MAKLLFKYATMNSGKTVDLLRTAYNYEENDGKVFILKPKVDTKGDDCLVSRLGQKRKVDLVVFYDDDLFTLLKGKLKNIDVILVDEAQFFSKKQIEDLSIISKVMNIDVICYGLRINFKGKMFEGSKKLFEVADAIDELVTLCKCRNIARFVGRKINGVFDLEGPEIIIDGSNPDVEYVPLCKECYLKEVKKIDFEKIKEKLS